MKYSIAEGIMLVTICDVSMLVATGTARAKFPFTNNLNETGVFYWKLLEQGKDTDMLTAEAKAVYGRTEEELRPGIEKFLSSLEKAGYIIPEGKIEMLKESEKNLLKILALVLHLENPEPELSENQWNEVFGLANHQKLLPVIFENLYKSKAAEQYHQLFGIYKKMTVQQVLYQIVKTAEFDRIYDMLCSRGLHPLLVKGELCGILYPLKDYRISVDDDIYVRAEEFLDCHRALLEYGLKTDIQEDKVEESEEIAYTDRGQSVCIEMHRKLFAFGGETAEDLNRFFEDAFSNAVKLEGYLSLPPHEHLLYLILHAYKHFIHSGVGLRQVCDIGLWACHYEKEINWLLLREQCASVHADIYAEALFKIAQERLELRWELPKCWDYSKIDEEAMLEDMFVGGLHGASTMSRLHSSTVTSNAVETERSGTKKSILRIVFPSRKFMVGKYPFVSKYPFLLPAAWLGRLFGYVLETGKYRDNSVSEGLETAKNRLKLLKQYGILS